MSRNTNNELWNHFERNDQIKTAECNYCKKSLSYKSTVTNLKQHLKLKPIGVFNQFVSRSSRSDTTNATTNTPNNANVHGVGNAGEGGPSNKANNNTACGDANNTPQSNLHVGLGIGEGTSRQPPKNVQKPMSSYLPRQLRPNEKKKLIKFY